ncbi:hypothetical protein GF361_03555, partial [Candidatus Woesearchaeota archaeon]|nr:hypothetical protein [Candidatus Woesearchaeota archaeon]
WNSDYGTDKIYKLDNNGSVIGSIDAPNSDISGLTFDGNYLWACDYQDDIIYKIFTNGTIADSFDTPYYYPRDITFDGSFLWNIDSDNGRIYRISTNGGFLENFNAPSVAPNGLSWQPKSSVIECYLNSECGTDGWIGNASCNGNDVWQDYRNYICYNPITNSSYCNYTDTYELKESCLNGCTNGTCNIECYNESDCGIDVYDSPYCSAGDVYNDYINYTCNNVGASNASCSNTATPNLNKTCSYGCDLGVCVNCSLDNDCGTDVWVGPEYCSNEDVWQIYGNYTCLDPGTINASCDYNESSMMKEDCTGNDICYNGSCITPNCTFDSDCGNDTWVGSGYCSNNAIWQIYGNYTCLNDGTINANCGYNEKIIIKENCSDGCFGGKCMGVICEKDSDCGTERYIGEKYCSGSNIVQKYRNYNCFSPGTNNSYCNHTEYEITRDSCSISCEDGYCIDSASYIWNTNSNSNKIYRLTLNGTVVDSFDRPKFFNGGIAWGGGYLWHITYDKTYKMTVDGVVVDSFDSPGDFFGLAWGEGYLWGSYYNDAKIYKMTADGTIIDSFDSPGDQPRGLVWDEGYLWNVDSNENKIYKLATDGTIIDSFDSPGLSPRGLAFESNSKIINCYLDSDCGIDSWIGNRYCESGDIKQEYKEYRCYNAGANNSYCHYHIIDKKRKHCEFGCSQGICLGNPSNYTCSEDSDCGTDRWIGNLWCESGDIYQNYRTWICNNASTSDAHCGYKDDVILKEECNSTCIDGECVADVCINDSDCGKDSYIETPYCTGNDVYQVYRTWSCAGTCSYSDNIQLKEGCAVACSNGICVDYDGKGDSGDDIEINHFVVQYPQIPVAGNFTVLAFNIENTGNATLNDVEWRLDTGGGSAIYGTVSKLDPGKGVVVARKITYPDARTYYPKIDADPDGKIAEFDESNNKRELVVVVS